MVAICNGLASHLAVAAVANILPQKPKVNPGDDEPCTFTAVKRKKSTLLPVFVASKFGVKTCKMFVFCGLIFTKEDTNVKLVLKTTFYFNYLNES